MAEVKMPQLGESVVEGTITKWLKKEGDQVEEDELIVEISTDKVDSEVPSTAAGVLQKILVQEGDTAQVGDSIAQVGDGAAGSGEEAKEDSGEPEAEQEEEPAAEDQDSEPDEGSEDDAQAAAEETGGTEEETGGTEESQAEEEDTTADDGGSDASAEADDAAAPEGEARVEEPQGEADTGSEDAGGSPDTSKRRIISPLVRRLADENDLDLANVEGTGTGGRIRKQDVLNALKERGAKPDEDQEAEPAAEKAGDQAPEEDEAAAPAAAAGAREELVPWTNIRRRTAEHMIASHLETARAWNAVEVDWTDVVAARTKAKVDFKGKEGFNLTYMPFLAKALCETLLEMPEVNATYDEDNKANLVKHYVNLGIAVALEGGGLIVPVVKGADEKNLIGLARSISDIAGRARAKKVTPDDLQGGSFTITNPGPFGSIVSVPIIPRGQTAILGFEAITKRVVVTDDDAIAVRSMGFLTMSWDHRAIDGAEAARFLAALRERIETTDFSADLSPYL